MLINTSNRTVTHLLKKKINLACAAPSRLPAVLLSSISQWSVHHVSVSHLTDNVFGHGLEKPSRFRVEKRKKNKTQETAR